MSLAYHREVLPKATQAIGYTWLIEYFKLDLPLRELCCISEIRLDTQKKQKGKWTIFDAQVKFENTGGFSACSASAVVACLGQGKHRYSNPKSNNPSAPFRMFLSIAFREHLIASSVVVVALQQAPMIDSMDPGGF